MNEDILTRLGAIGDGTITNPHEYLTETARDAASEIRRLREALAGVRKEADFAPLFWPFALPDEVNGAINERRARLQRIQEICAGAGAA